MSAQDHIAQLERLARLHEAGALSDAEFEGEKARLLHRDAKEQESGQIPAPDSALGQEKRQRRWPYLLGVGLVLAGAGAWTLAPWSMVRPPAVSAEHASPAGLRPSAAAAPEVGQEPASSVIRKLPAQRQVDLAIDAIFGTRAREIRVQEDAVYRYGKGRVVWTDFGPVLIVEGSGDPSPLGFGTLGLFYLREMPGARFEEVHRWPDAVAGGTMGSPPQWKIRTDIVAGPVIEATAGGVWQGYRCDTTTLTEVTPTGPKLLGTIASSYSSEGAEGDAGQNYEGTIVNAVLGRSFDVRFTGTRTITQHFVRKGAEYVRVPNQGEEMNESALPTC